MGLVFGIQLLHEESGSRSIRRRYMDDEFG